MSDRLNINKFKLFDEGRGYQHLAFTCSSLTRRYISVVEISEPVCRIFGVFQRRFVLNIYSLSVFVNFISKSGSSYLKSENRQSGFSLMKSFVSPSCSDVVVAALVRCNAFRCVDAGQKE